MFEGNRGRRAARWVRSVAALAAAVLAVGGVGGCESRLAAEREPSASNIVLIVIDTLRADHLGCYGYFRDTSPNIDVFAEQAVFFERAYTPLATTLPAHVSLLTGLYPLEHGVLANFGDGGEPFGRRRGIKSFAELARANGYATAAFVSAAPLKRVCGLAVGFDVYDEPPGVEREARGTTEAALAWMSAHADERFFLFVHYFDPHVPYRPPGAFAALFRTGRELEAYIAEREIPDVIYPALCRGSVPTVTREATNLYDGEIRYCDEQVGRLLNGLRTRGLWDKSVIIVTADHGEGINQHDWPQHGRTWHEQVHVPLMIRFPGRRGDLPKRVAPLVALIDVFPTVLGWLKPSWAQTFLEQAQGVDVLGPGFAERPLLSQRSARDCREYGGALYALTTRQWRYHCTPEAEELLFDRLSDPHELRNVAAQTPDVLEELRRKTRELVRELEERAGRFGPVPAGPPELDEQYLRQMQALGYVGDAGEEQEGEGEEKEKEGAERAPGPPTQPASRGARP